MPTAKGKGGAAAHRYRPASEYDDATLAQKREYWRNKKREQRARLSERRGKPAHASQGETPPRLNAPAGANSCLSDAISVSCSPLKGNDSFSCAPHSQNTEVGILFKDNESQDGKWLQAAELGEVLPPLPASHPVSAKPAGGNTAALKHPAVRGALRMAVTSAASSGSQPNTSSSVPPVRATPTLNGSSTTAAPQPFVSMQGAFVPKPQDKAQTTPPAQPRGSPTRVTAGIAPVSSPCGPGSIKTEGTTVSPPPQAGTSALVVAQRAKGNAHPSLESEEEKAAKRREIWRIKKREQRAKLAARLPKNRERERGAEAALHEETAPGSRGRMVLHPCQPGLRGPIQRRRAGPVACSSVKQERDELQSGAAAVAVGNLQRDPAKSPHGNHIMQSIPVDGALVRRRLDSLRKPQNHVYLNSVTRGMARCKTPRQRFIDAQKTFMHLRNLRCKSPFVSSVFGPRGMPRIDPNDTPEQIIAKRREYWRLKKREQRAKLSVEVKARLKEKDSLMRRVKRYQHILEEMRKARAPARSVGGALTHASETIGGFIKEDGTLTVNIPQNPANYVSATNKSEEVCRVVPKNQPTAKHRGVGPVRVKPPPSSLGPPQVKVSFPLAGQSANKPPSLLSIRPHAHLESTTLPDPQPLAVQSAGQLTLSHPHTAQDSLSPGPAAGPAAGPALGGCVMKMAVSCSAPSLPGLSLDPGLTEEVKMAKKREYWRMKKREQRAARAFCLKQGVFQSRAFSALQRIKAQKQAPVPPVPLCPVSCPASAQPLPPDGASVTPEVKQEGRSLPAPDLSSQPDPAVCPDVKPPPPSPPPPELDPALTADSQATTLLAVASMKKLLEESLSTVTDGSQTDIKVEASDEASDEDIKPHLPQLFLDSDDMSPVTADLTLQMRDWQPEDGDVDGDVAQEPISPQLDQSFFIGETSPPLPPTCESSSQTPSSFILTPDGPSSPHLHLENSPETPGLHGVPAASPDRRQDEPQRRPPDGGPPPPPAQSSLQRKREYWKLMKRQQRARLKAHQKDRSRESSQRTRPRNTRTPGLVTIMPKQPVAPPPLAAAAAGSIPAVLLVSRPAVPAPRSPDSLLQLPSPGTDGNSAALQLSPVKEWTCPPEWTCEGADAAPSPPTLKPPDNPLSSINLQPIEPPGPSPPAVLSPIRIPSPQPQSPAHTLPSPPARPPPASTLAPPKPVPGESQEDFLRRKREYWRIKKKEQRARKASQQKDSPPKMASSSSSRPVLLPAEDPHPQDCEQWAESEDPQRIMSVAMDGGPGGFSYTDYPVPAGDEPDVLFSELDGAGGDEAPVSDGVWRSRYLMDHDPLNQLLVCMVCGELQYSHGLEGVRAHIDEAHPHTLGLDPAHRRRILEAWDEQVSRRERFFTSQLQQHGGALADSQRN
ncbi:serine/arginine repetitive matrix protein 2 [Salarias fasciatus]|uniref:serine/arginine repetitive matrix protein 2 n=1 Tax=Salarias fasciatus TaxID=181472 RepID=UPI0011765449|nr:serine/arginine repetitive matrix protein 2-like [Salarias fasciatus]